MSKQFWISLLVIAALFSGFILINNHNKQANGGSSSGTVTNHVQGTSPENVKLVEYGDYECPVCESFYPTVKQVTEKYNDRIMFQFSNLPLISIHPNAFAGARAAEAAGLQGKFWEMHDLLYENQSSWVSASDPLSVFNSYAKALKLDQAKFDSDYAGDKVNGAINADLAQFGTDFKAATGSYDPGQDLATPTFFLDGRKLNNTDLVDSGGTPNLAAFSKVIDAELAKKAKS